MWIKRKEWNEIISDIREMKRRIDNLERGPLYLIGYEKDSLFPYVRYGYPVSPITVSIQEAIDAILSHLGMRISKIDISKTEIKLEENK